MLQLLQGTKPATQPAVRRIAIAMLPDAPLFEVGAAMEVLREAEGVLRDAGAASPSYRVDIVALNAGPTTTACGLSIVATLGFEGFASSLPDTVIVVGGGGATVPETDAVAGFAARAVTRSVRACATHTAAALLRDAGFPAAAQACAPRLGASSLDIALALVREDHGHAVAEAVALRRAALHARRTEAAMAHAPALAAVPATKSRMRALAEWILQDPARDFSLELLASRAAVSARTLSRRFVLETGTTPAKFVELARLERARRLLEQSSIGMERVATQAGFACEERMRRSFHRLLGMSPRDYRRAHAPRPFAFDMLPQAPRARPMPVALAA